jgi:GNAT superfamily N-acetyltransferase
MARASIRVRFATARDLPVLVRHRRGMFEDMGVGTPRQHEQHDRRYLAWMRRMRAARRFVAFIAIDRGGAVLGSGAIWLEERQPRPGTDDAYAPYLLSMYTVPAFRGRGVATRIVTIAKRWAKQHGYAGMSLHASPQGRRLYERLGWERTREYRIRC